MVDPVQACETEAVSIAAHNTGWLRDHWPCLLGLVVAFVAGMLVR